MNFAALMLFTSILTHLGGDATKKSKVCAMRRWPACALEQRDIPASNFSVLAIEVSEADENGDISVLLRVHRTQCPTPEMTDLHWYRLQALAEDTNVNIGRFIEPIQSRRLETYSCQNDSNIVFETCEPHPLDLPREYTWKVPAANTTTDDIICFRLTVLDDDEQTCKVAETCISLSPSSGGSGREEELTTRSQIGSGAFGESVNVTEKCYQRWDCSNARLRLFCGSDGNTYTSRCHIRLVECLTNTDISIKYAGQCVEEPTPVCDNVRKTIVNLLNNTEYAEHTVWLPTCDCDGLFKPKQCQRDPLDGSLECWCSYSNSMSEVANTRRRITDVCTDPSKFEFSCSTL